MPYQRSKYNSAQTGEWKSKAAVVLAESPEAMDIDAIKRGDMALINITNQKMARILNELVDQGFAVKGKNRAGRVIFKSAAIMAEQGYDMRDIH